MNATPRIATAALLLALLALLAGCGNKGPLVLPTAPAEAPDDTAPGDAAPVEPVPAEVDAQDAPPVEPPVDIPADGDGRR